MKLNYKNSKSIGIVIGIVLFIALIGGITYAIFNWRSTDTNISLDTKCFDIQGNSSYTVTGNNSNMLLFDENDILDTTNNTITYKNGMIYYPFNITRGSECNTDVYYEIIVNVTTLSEDYRNGSLKYKIIGDMSSYTSEKIANPLNENLDYDEIYSGSILNIGTYTIYTKNVSLNTNIIPAVIFYLDGDLVPEDASNFAFSASIEVVGNQGINAAKYITDLYSKAEKITATVNNITYNLAPSVGLMNDRHASMSTDINGGDIRYYGENPNNYVWLGDSNNGIKKLWRVVGIFDGRLKLVSNDPISTTNLSWDTSANTTGGNSGNGINQWGPSGTYEGADLMKLLNEGYTGTNGSLYWTKGTGSVYTNYNNATTSNVSFANTGLTANERSLIDTATWYTGAYDQVSYADAHYTAERGNMGKICTQGTRYCDDTVTRTNTWNGKVGLISASDYGYAANLAQCNKTLNNYSSCTSSNWLSIGRFEWTLSSCAYSGDAINVFLVDRDGGLYRDYAYIDRAVRPAVYLKSGVTIVTKDKDGSQSNPFEILG